MSKASPEKTANLILNNLVKDTKRVHQRVRFDLRPRNGNRNRSIPKRQAGTQTTPSLYQKLMSPAILDCWLEGVARTGKDGAESIV